MSLAEKGFKRIGHKRQLRESVGLPNNVQKRRRSQVERYERSYASKVLLTRRTCLLSFSASQTRRSVTSDMQTSDSI